MQRRSTVGSHNCFPSNNKNRLTRALVDKEASSRKAVRGTKTAHNARRTSRYSAKLDDAESLVLLEICIQQTAETRKKLEIKFGEQNAERGVSSGKRIRLFSFCFSLFVRPRRATERERGLVTHALRGHAKFIARGANSTTRANPRRRRLSSSSRHWRARLLNFSVNSERGCNPANSTVALCGRQPIKKAAACVAKNTHGPCVKKESRFSAKCWANFNKWRFSFRSIVVDGWTAADWEPGRVEFSRADFSSLLKLLAAKSFPCIPNHGFGYYAERLESDHIRDYILLANIWISAYFGWVNV
jgi:hypothetical protein